MNARRILIVEDEPIVRLHMQRIVADAGHSLCGSAGNAEQALAIAEREPMTTQGHYGNYLAMIPRLAGDDKTMQHIISLALIRAGANATGVRSAMKILGG